MEVSLKNIDYFQQKTSFYKKEKRYYRVVKRQFFCAGRKDISNLRMMFEETHAVVLLLLQICEKISLAKRRFF